LLDLTLSLQLQSFLWKRFQDGNLRFCYGFRANIIPPMAMEVPMASVLLLLLLLQD
jgi:hypothetical protein